MIKRAIPALTTLWILVALPASRAAEQKLSRNQLPEAVRKTADEQARNATVRAYSKDTEDGQLEYEVSMTFNGHNRDVAIGPDGRLLEVEEEVSFDALPAKVRTGLTAKANGARVGKVESITKRGILVAYEAQIAKAGKHAEVQVGPDGNPLDHEE